MFTHLVSSQLNQTYYSRIASTAEIGQDVIFTQSIRGLIERAVVAFVCAFQPFDFIQVGKASPSWLAVYLCFKQASGMAAAFILFINLLISKNNQYRTLQSVM